VPDWTLDLPDSAGLDAVSEVDRSVEILREHGGTEAVRRAVGTLDHLVQRLELHYLHHWAEDLQTRVILLTATV